MKVTAPAEVSKPNGASVPDVYAIPGKFDQMVILRFKYQADLLAGMEKGSGAAWRGAVCRF